jgi:hypothetical protein
MYVTDLTADWFRREKEAERGSGGKESGEGETESERFERLGRVGNLC